MLRPFRLHEPTTVEEATSLLADLGEAARPYAGGTELLLVMKAGVLAYDHLVNVKTVAGLAGIELDAGVLRIGAAVTHRELESSAVLRERFALLASVERRVANVRVRNVGTLGGNLCFAEPHSDPGTALLLYDASVEVAGPSGRRTIAVEALASGPYETALADDELLTRIDVPELPAGMAGAYLKFGYHQRPTLGVGVAVRLSGGARPAIEDVRVALGSVSPRPLRLRGVEDRLRGCSTADAVALASGDAGDLAAAASEAVDDLHGSAEYKRHVTKVYLGRALEQAIEAALAAGPQRGA